VDVQLARGITLSFCNLVDADDTLVGFDGTAWHSHGAVGFCTTPGDFVEFDEIDIVIALRAGDLVVVTRIAAGSVADRWLHHKDEPLDLRYLSAGEELRVTSFRAATERISNAGNGPSEA
jgi:hypothetical protein